MDRCKDVNRAPVTMRRVSPQMLGKTMEDMGGKNSTSKNLPMPVEPTECDGSEDQGEKTKKKPFLISPHHREGGAGDMSFYTKVRRNFYSELISGRLGEKVKWPVGPEVRELPTGEERRYPPDVERAAIVHEYTPEGAYRAAATLKSEKSRSLFLYSILANTPRGIDDIAKPPTQKKSGKKRKVAFRLDGEKEPASTEKRNVPYSLPNIEEEYMTQEVGSSSSSSSEEEVPAQQVEDEGEEETHRPQLTATEREWSDTSAASAEEFFGVEKAVEEEVEAAPEIASFGPEDDVCTCEGRGHDHAFFTGGEDLQHSKIYLTDEEDERPTTGGVDRDVESHLHWIFVGKCVFPASSLLPKMLYPAVAPAGRPPLQTMVQKRKSEYSLFSTQEILHEMLRIDPFHLVPPKYIDIPDNKKHGLFSSAHFIPIEYFDNDYYDVWTNEKWMETSVGMDGCEYPVPALAFIPQSIRYRQLPDGEICKYTHHEWTYVAVYHYEPDTNLFSVVPVALDRGPYHIHRIYICFKSENPITAASRIYQAMTERDEAETTLRYDDVKEFTKKMNIRRPTLENWANILALSTQNNKLKKYRKVYRSFRIFYERTLTDLLLKKIVTDSPVFSFINIPVKKVWVPKNQVIVTGSNAKKFKAYQAAYMKETIYALDGIYSTMNEIFNKCEYLTQTCLFGINECYELKLTAFNAIQGTTINQMELFIKETWSSSVIKALNDILENQGKGYYNINEDNFIFYEHSKVCRIMWLVKFYMEHGLRNLLRESINQYVTMFESQSCDGILDLPDDFVWGDILNYSPYVPKKKPIFRIILRLDENGGHYCTDLLKFKEAILMAYENVINMTHQIPQIDRRINTLLKYPPVMNLLNCVSLLGGEIQKGRDDLDKILDKALIPIKAYREEYKRFVELYCLNVDEYVEQFKDENHLASEVTSEIEKQVAFIKDLDDSLPTSITIGMFQIDTHLVKDLLMNKRKEIRNKHLNAHAARLKEAMESAMIDYMNIYRKLCEKPVSIENIIELKEWMETVPLAVAGYDDAIHTRLLDYEVLDFFNYSLSNTDFDIKWDAITWPYKIKCKMEETEALLIEESEKFLKLQQIDEGELQDKIDYLSSVITNLSGQDDINKVHPIAVEVRLAWKGVKEAQEFGILLNQRQKLFEIPVTPFDEIPKLIKEFEPYKNLWGTASDWCKAYDFYMDNPLCTINTDLIDATVTEYYKTMVKCIRVFKDIPACQKIAMEMRQLIEEFRPLIPIIQAINHPGMKTRHWTQFKEKTGINIIPTPYLTFKQCLDAGVQDQFEVLKEIVDLAGKEFVLEQALTKMQGEWEEANMSVTPYKTTGSYIMKITDEQLQMLDDHIALTQQLTFSPFKGAFEQEIEDWNAKIRIASEVLDEWFECQKSWMYLEPILTSEDIAHQLPIESKRFSTVQRSWRRIMKAAYDNPAILDYCSNKKLFDQFVQNNRILDQVQRGLTDYLEQKRLNFPRLFFLSDDELLEILSQSKYPWAVQPHLKKCFENIYLLDFIDGTHITVMYSGEGECVKLIPDMYATGSVEVWLLKVEEIMRNTIRETISIALKVIEETPKTKWVLDWPGQVVIAGSQTYWTAHVEKGIRERGLKSYYNTMLKQLDGLRGLLKSKLTRVEREVMSALIVIEVHARDVLQNLVELKVSSVNEFDWISQLRYYWVVDELKVRAVNAEFNYGYEYLGNSGRLVITPLTDRCYLTLTGALHLKFGGAPAGPAGTGKTETTKDLAKAFAIQCVVFNCSDQLDFKAMGKFFKGLASSGAWACFDEFNRIDIEVLSVIAQQITTIQKAQMSRVEKFMFEGTELSLKAACSVFITMNPGYAGRTELPDNLKALFRPVAMMVPDYTLIAEISLFSYGFSDAKLMAGKITTTFKLSSEQLSSQDHYDFGMRAVKTVIAAAGNLKRENPDMDEKQIVLRALKDVNVPKFLRDDLKLFNGIVSDLFPRMQEQHVDYGRLELSIRQVCNDFGLEDVDEYVMKVIQLYETTVVRHGLMLVGPTGSGKTKCYQILKQAITNLQGEMSPSGSPFEAVYTYVLNPKSITMGQLYGEFDLLTHEWTDGILPSMVRIGASAEDLNKRWYVFDGPVDAVWIENMNTVLDDNKKLCLTSGEIIKLTSSMTLMFEVADLAVASPATVSRCGMVYIEPSVLGLLPFINCWIRRLPKLAKGHGEAFQELFSRYLLPGVELLRSRLKEIVASVDSAIVLSFLKLLDSFLAPLTMKDNRPPPSAKFLKLMPQLIPIWVIFSLVWSVGATCNANSQAIFSNWLIEIMTANNEEPPFPQNSQAYDYRFHDGGFTMATPSGEPEPPMWVHWMTGVPEYRILIDSKYSDIEVPTINSVRNAELLGMLLINENNVLCVGPTGTGKTLTILNKLSRNMPKKFVSDFLNFSARTSANQTQDLIDSKLDKRRRGVYGPPVLKRLALFIDDFNMPALEVYGAQPPIELIRQWMDFGGWYDRQNIGDFRTLIDLNFVAAMGPPGGGRNPVTPRLLRHFHFLAFTEMDDDCKKMIFSTILGSWLTHTSLPEDYVDYTLKASLNVYSTVIKELLPTPAKTHYTFNLRDLSKVFQGIFMTVPEDVPTFIVYLHLWFHENCRVFEDRMVNDKDRAWFQALLHRQMVEDFHVEPNQVLSQEPILFADFIQPDFRRYSMVTDLHTMLNVLNNYLAEYNATSTAPMNLVLFYDAMSHISRICRIIRQPQGNALLLGMGGSGRQSLTRLSTHINEMTCYQIVLNKSFGINEWKDSVKDLMLKAGVYGKETVFLFSDTQIKYESFLEDLNNMLNSGDVPNIYQPEDLDIIYQAMRVPVTDAGLDPTKSNLFQFYLKEVRANLHIVITMSPIGEIFRARLRQFPALVNCCTIDWFSPWPDAALQVGKPISLTPEISVAQQFLEGQPFIGASDDVLTGIVYCCMEMHQSVIQASDRFLQELSRHNYVTPTSYLQLLYSYLDMMEKTKTIQINGISRLQGGLDKLQQTAKDVEVMQVELEAMQPELIAAQEAASVMVEKIEADKVVAEATKEQVENEEKAAAKMAAETQSIAEDAAADLEQVLPMLREAENSLKSLNKGDISEVRSLKRPPEGVVLVLESICIIKDIKPAKTTMPDGKKVLSYWEPGRNMLADPGAFLNSLMNFNKAELTEALVVKLKPYIDNPNFRPAKIKLVSKACMSLCQWVHAMVNYYYVNLTVAPKKAALQEAQDRLEVVEIALAKSRARLKAVEEGMARLLAKLEETVSRKKELEDNSALCMARLDRAFRLINGLSGESVRWKQSVEVMKVTLGDITGNILISAGAIAYLAPFTEAYRNRLLIEWVHTLDEYHITHSQECRPVEILGDPVQVRIWQLQGLPRDSLSTENAILVSNSTRWPLFIDPQGQANRWIKNMSRERNLKVMKPTDKDLMREMERALTFGWTVLIENLGTSIDQAMDPILNRQTFIQNGELYMKLGDSVIPYNNTFKLYLTTKMPNPHYMPEVSVKVLVVNFALVPSGLQDQLLAEVVMQERPDLEEARSRIIVSSAQMRSELKEIETKILQRLAESQGNPVDDIDLITTLEESKSMSSEIRSKVESSAETQSQIDAIRLTYIPVAERAQILFFCVADLGKMDPMYQYSLEWFTRIFIDSMDQTEKNPNVPERIQIINDFFTFELYSRVCRSLFEKNKLQFAFLLCIRILLNKGDIDPNDWTFFLAGGSPVREISNPVKWLTNRSWTEILSLENLPIFKSFVESFIVSYDSYKHIIDSTQPHREPLPQPWNSNFDAFHKMVIVKCLRPDKVTNCMQDFLSEHLGQQFIEPQTSDLAAMYKDSSVSSPLVFILSPGTDPAAELYKFADKLKMTKRLSSISLGQGQGPIAEAMFLEAREAGGWVFFQNCHLAPSWMPRLEYLVENIIPDSVHKAFRVWLTSTPSPHFPVTILQNGSKLTIEPPRGVKANLLKSYSRQVPEFSEFLESDNSKVQPFKWLLFSLCLFHGVCLERRKFGPLGFNIPYEFTDGDLRICISQLHMFLLEYEDVPFKVLSFTAGQINYGGRVTDDWDRRCLMNLLADYYNPTVLSDKYAFDENKSYCQLAVGASLLDYVDYIKALPMNDTPGLFGLHDNADISCAQAETYTSLAVLLSLQSKQAGGQAASPEEVTANLAHQITSLLPKPFPNIDQLQKKYPVMYEESLNTVLIQEVVRFNKLLAAIHSSLEELLKALQGLVVMSESLEKMSESLFTNKVPAMWAAKAYPSLKPLGAWVTDLQMRIDFINGWINGGIPSSFWISGFYFPQAFLTACQQNFARKYIVSIDSLSYKFTILKEKPSRRPDDGCVVYGLFLEGARWDFNPMLLAESLPKQLYTSMPPIWFVPEQRHKKLAFGIYDCPVYKTLQRAGTLSTTGHSTNYVLTIEVPTDRQQAHWIKRGVALFCALDY